jgi:hypothetical protein
MSGSPAFWQTPPRSDRKCNPGVGPLRDHHTNHSGDRAAGDHTTPPGITREDGRLTPPDQLTKQQQLSVLEFPTKPEHLRT